MNRLQGLTSLTCFSAWSAKFVANGVEIGLPPGRGLPMDFSHSQSLSSSTMADQSQMLPARVLRAHDKEVLDLCYVWKPNESTFGELASPLMQTPPRRQRPHTLAMFLWSSVAHNLPTLAFQLSSYSQTERTRSPREALVAWGLSLCLSVPLHCNLGQRIRPFLSRPVPEIFRPPVDPRLPEPWIPFIARLPPFLLLTQTLKCAPL